MAWLKDRNSDRYKQQRRTGERRTTGLLNLILALAVAAVAYSDWLVDENDSLG
jgi:hypothetical protein